MSACFVVVGCTPRLPPELTPPPAPREFRAAWVATVDNIDWPSQRTLTSEQQQHEIITILDRAAELKLNAIIFQVRTSCDALYDSKLEPWSEYLTGTQGQAPDPYYDPLKMWIDEAHKRGIELHAWFNPYRARHPSAKSPNAANHLANRKPKVVKQYGQYLWLDPAEPEAARHSLAVFLDVARRYDVDGIHIDDYFYPYPISVEGKEVDFPDEPAWEDYRKKGGKLARADWRRQNIDRFIKRLYHDLKRTRRELKFGISPFGIGKPSQRPAGIEGFSQYDKLYADAELWLSRGWCDYFTPQLYWPIAQTKQAFPVLMSYWLAQNPKQLHVWPGLFTSRINQRQNPWKPEEIVNQISVTRDKSSHDPGHVHFSVKALMGDQNALVEELKSGPYKDPALVPPTKWLDGWRPPPPSARIAARSTASIHLTLSPGWFDRPWLWAIWMKEGSQWTFKVVPGSMRELEIPAIATHGSVTAVVVSSVDRCGNESDRVLAAE
jgi:uncharacterized lipoprotein YddW (UPF0748 family)